MSHSPTRARKPPKAKVAARGKRSQTGLMAALVVVVVTVALAMSASPWMPQIFPGPPVEAEAIKSSSASLMSNQIGEDLLRGRWVRPDGGYVIEVRDAQAGGRLEAAYFNPRSINVSRAEWHRADDGLHVFVELRGVNYPGATYQLRYLQAKDQLVGGYFQPLHQQTFPVHFLRESR
jgi:hypothetical protein